MGSEMCIRDRYDQVGFGFHRYSTDAKWLVPHFEKMLYDQAILVQAYLDAYQATGKQYYVDVVNEILEIGGKAEANSDDVADWEQAENIVSHAVEKWGRLDALICNAGFLRDRMLVGMSEEEWDSVIRVHLKGHLAPARHASGYWRALAKEGKEVEGRIVMTSSGAGLMLSLIHI